MSGLLVLLALASSAGPPRPAGAPGAVVLRQRVIVRMRTYGASPPPRPAELKERKGPRCIPLAALGGAAVVAPAAIDFVLRNGLRVRARFRASCPSLDYYQGFYVAPGRDAMVCSGRDMIHDRSGGVCAIDRFRLLVPAR